MWDGHDQGAQADILTRFYPAFAAMATTFERVDLSKGQSEILLVMTMGKAASQPNLSVTTGILTEVQLFDLSCQPALVRNRMLGTTRPQTMICRK